MPEAESNLATTGIQPILLVYSLIQFTAISDTTTLPILNYIFMQEKERIFKMSHLIKRKQLNGKFIISFSLDKVELKHQSIT